MGHPQVGGAPEARIWAHWVAHTKKDITKEIELKLYALSIMASIRIVNSFQLTSKELQAGKIVP